MAISKTTLAAIQKTGSFATNLKLALQAETKKYADRLSKALSTNANGNALELLDGVEITNWKSVAKLTKMVDAIEAELNSAIKFATALVTGTPPAAAVTVEKAPQVAVAKVKVAPAKKAAPKSQSKAPVGRGANAEKLLAELTSMLSSGEFTVLKQTELAKSTGIPLGSMTAALKKLTEAGDLVLGKNSGYKLGKKKATSAAKAAVAAVMPAKTEAKSATKSPAPEATVAVTPEATTPKATAKKKAEKAAPVAKKVATKATTPKTAAVVNAPKLVKPVVTTTKPMAKAAAKKAPAKKAAATVKPAEAAASKIDVTNSEPAVEAAAQDTAVLVAS